MLSVGCSVATRSQDAVDGTEFPFGRFPGAVSGLVTVGYRTNGMHGTEEGYGRMRSFRSPLPCIDCLFPSL
jgi:hypothetical protein